MAISIQLSMQDEPKTANQLKTEFGLTCHEKTVRTSLRYMGFRYKMIEQVIYLSVKHREERLKFADEHIIKMTIWFPYIFSDEKKWSVKGPDGPIKAWMREAAPNMDIEQGNSKEWVMVWAGFSGFGKLRLFTSFCGRAGVLTTTVL